jgi:ABC-type phosphate transport system substrate-binding protein
MRMRNKLLAGAAVVATATALSAGAALADPPAGVTPPPGSVVSVGANTTQYLSDALSATWNHKFPAKTQLYSWDALDAAGVDNSIVTKKGCAAITRPNGSGPGIANLGDNVKDPLNHKDYCIDFARSSRGRKTSDPTDIIFVPLAFDSVTYASLAKGSNAPHNLTTADLKLIYSCSVPAVPKKKIPANNWAFFPGGKKGTIAPLLAQSGSGTVSFFLSAIGGSTFTPGPCVTQPTKLEENEGVNPIFKGKNAKNEIIPFSAGDWVAQAYHSAKCLNTACSSNSKGVVCKPNTKKGQNAFGCDLNGVLGLNDINGTSPTTGTGAKTTLNPRFTLGFVRTLSDVVRGTSTIPGYLVQFLGPKGWFCTNQALIRDYGFLTDPACGKI